MRGVTQALVACAGVLALMLWVSPAGAATYVGGPAVGDGGPDTGHGRLPTSAAAPAPFEDAPGVRQAQPTPAEWKSALLALLNPDLGTPEDRALLRAVLGVDPERPAAPTTLRGAPSLYQDAGTPAHAQPATYVYPHLSSLSKYGRDERAIPYGDTDVLALGPGGYGRVLVGQPQHGSRPIANSVETAMSYVRPHVSVQMALAMDLPGTASAAGFEGGGMDTRAQLVVDHLTRVRSEEIGGTTEQFGRRPIAPVGDESQTAVAVGMDLGILPTFLAQMGMNLSLVVARGDESGDLTLSVVGATELPVDWAPRERPQNYPSGPAVQPLAMTDAIGSPRFGSPAISSSDGPSFPQEGGGEEGGGGGDDPTPIDPVIPEPATAALVAAGAAVLARMRRRAA